MNGPRAKTCQFLACMPALLICAAVTHGSQAGTPQETQDQTRPATAHQRFEEEEKKLLANVQAAESGDPNPVLVARSLQALAMFYQHQNRKSELSPILARELAAVEKAWPEDSREFNRTLHEIGMGYMLCGERDRANEILQRVMAIDVRLEGLKSPAVASDLVSLGHLYLTDKDSPAAETYFLQALAINQLRNDDRAVTQNIQDLSTVAKIKKDPEKADALLVRAIETLQPNAERNGAQIAGLWIDRANLASSRRDFASATNYVQQALTIQERVYGPNSPMVTSTLTNLGVKFMEQDDLGEAEHYIQQAVEITEAGAAASDKDSAKLAMIGPLSSLARVYERQKKYRESEAAILRVMDIVNKVRGADYPTLAN